MEVKKKKIVVGLTGPIAGGKGVVAEYLKKKGFFYSSTSDRIREEIMRRDGEITREGLQEVADELRQKYGPEVLAKRTWRKVVGQSKKRAVIDSIRGETEVDFLKTKANFYLIGVTAPRKTRFKRVKERNRERDPIGWKEFLRIDERDFKSGKGKIGRNIKKCLKKADFLIINDGSLNELGKKIRIVIKEIEGS